MPTVRQRYGQTDGQTDLRLMIAIPCFALRASRGKKYCERENYTFSMPLIQRLYDFSNIFPATKINIICTVEGCHIVVFLMGGHLSSRTKNYAVTVTQNASMIHQTQSTPTKWHQLFLGLHHEGSAILCSCQNF